MACAATHLPGGNRFDDVRLDVARSIDGQEEWLASTPRRSVRRSRLRNGAALAALVLEKKLGLRGPLVDVGIRDAWYREFAGYWYEVVGGRPLTVVDLHQLRFLYRVRAQQTERFAWDSAERHLANWQEPYNLSATMQFVYRAALEPVRSKLLLGHLKPGMRVLEYGCSLAPMYRTWREYLSHRRSSWVLADIASFPFHYARHVYGGDAEASFHVIRDLADPLRGVDGEFDLIIVQEVFEHLDRPLEIARELVGRLAAGGLLWFDYELSDACGHNTPAGVAERTATLEYLASVLFPVHGELRTAAESLPTVVARRR